MNTKFFTFIFLLTFLSIYQKSTAQTVGIVVGANFANIIDNHSSEAIASEESECLPSDPRLSYRIGAVIDVPLGFISPFSFQPGVILSNKGQVEVDGEYESTTKLSYIEIPLNFNYKIEIGFFSKIVLSAGPYAAFAIAGEVEYELGAVDIKFGSDANTHDMKGTDYGVNAGVAYQREGMKNYSIGIQYGVGIVNLNNFNEINSTNQALNLSFTYFFEL